MRSLLSLLIVLFLSSIAFAQSIPDIGNLPTGHRPNSLHVFDGLAVGVNPLVLGDQLKVYYKMPWGEGRSMLTADSHWRVGMNNIISPTYVRPAVMIGVSPAPARNTACHCGPRPLTPVIFSATAWSQGLAGGICTFRPSAPCVH